MNHFSFMRLERNSGKVDLCCLSPVCVTSCLSLWLFHLFMLHFLKSTQLNPMMAVSSPCVSPMLASHGSETAHAQLNIGVHKHEGWEETELLCLLWFPVLEARCCKSASITWILHHRDIYSFITHLPVLLSKYLSAVHTTSCPGNWDTAYWIESSQWTHVPTKLKITYDILTSDDDDKYWDVISTMQEDKKSCFVSISDRRSGKTFLIRWHLDWDLEKKGKQLCKDQRSAEKINAKYLLKQDLVITGIINIWMYILYLCVCL